MVHKIKKESRSIIMFLILFCLALNCTAKDFVVVIDPGHGGHDKGALGINTYEKDINLNIALQLGDFIKSNMKDVKVVFTRDDDTYITLQERANIANKANGDLFISVHTNSIDRKSKNRKTINGSMTFTLGLHKSEANLEVAKRENSVIELEADYTTTYKGFDPNSTESYIIFEINQSKHMEQSVNFASNIQREFVDIAERNDKGVRQAGFWVLAATSMPSVLIELDFICNPMQEEFLASKDGQKKMAKAIYTAFKNYKESSDHKMALNGKGKSIKIEETKEESPKLDKVVVKPKAAKSSSRNKSEVKEVSEDDYKYSVRRGYKNKEQDSLNEELMINDSDKDKSETVYKVQFLTSAKVLKDNSYQLKGLENVDYYKEGSLYKYIYGSTSDMDEAKQMLKTVKSKFKEAFIVKFKDGKRIN